MKSKFLTFGVAIMSSASLLLAVPPTLAATKFVGSSSLFAGTGGAPSKNLMGYYVTSDTVRLFSDYAIRQILANDTGAALGFYSGGVVTDPANRDIVYFATLKQMTGGVSRWRLNTYNFKTRWFSILFTKDIPSPATDYTTPTDYELVGIDGTNLVFDGMTDNSPGPCVNSWTAGDTFYQVDVRRPSQGIKTYTVPKYLIAQGDAASKACEKEMAPAQPVVPVDPITFMTTGLDVHVVSKWTDASPADFSSQLSLESLKGGASECGQAIKSDSYYQFVLSSLAKGKAVEYDITSNAASQDPTFKVYALANTPGYVNLDAAKTDLDVCAAGGIYPIAVNSKWIVFTGSCGGASDASLPPALCGKIQQSVAPTIKFVQ